MGGPLHHPPGGPPPPVGEETRRDRRATPQPSSPPPTGEGDHAQHAGGGSPIAFNLENLPPSFHENPYPTYRALRERDPVHRMPNGGLFLTRYGDVERVYKDPATFASDKKVEFGEKFGPSPLFDHHTTSLVFNDPPLHTRVRSIIGGALTPRAIGAMEPGVVALVDGLLDRMAKRGPHADVIEDFAAAIPIEVIGNLLGVPRDEREPLRDWSLAILGALEPGSQPARLAAGNAAVVEFVAYLETLVARRRASPGDPEQDLLTRLILGEQGGERLSEAELLQNVVFILNAGHETTTNLIGNGLHILLDRPEDRARLVAEPDLARLAVEEILRFESSNQLGNRASTAPFEMAGHPFPAGTSLTLCIGAANRDPAEFPDPDRFDIGRRPNRHLAFASGIHRCVGLAVAQLEGRIALLRFLARFPDYRADGTPERGMRVRFRGFAKLPVRLW